MCIVIRSFIQSIPVQCHNHQSYHLLLLLSKYQLLASYLSFFRNWIFEHLAHFLGLFCHFLHLLRHFKFFNYRWQPSQRKCICNWLLPPLTFTEGLNDWALASSLQRFIRLVLKLMYFYVRWPIFALLSRNFSSSRALYSWTVIPVFSAFARSCLSRSSWHLILCSAICLFFSSSLFLPYVCHSSFVKTTNDVLFSLKVCYYYAYSPLP